MAGGLVSPQLERARLLVLLFSLCLDTPSPLEASHVRESSSMAGGLEVSGRAREPTQLSAIPDHKASLVHGPRLIPRGRGLCSWATGEKEAEGGVLVNRLQDRKRRSLSVS